MIGCGDGGGVVVVVGGGCPCGDCDGGGGGLGGEWEGVDDGVIGGTGLCTQNVRDVQRYSIAMTKLKIYESRSQRSRALVQFFVV